MVKKENKTKKINTNVSLNLDLKKKLQVYAVWNNTTLSAILNQAGQTYLSNTENVMVE